MDDKEHAGEQEGGSSATEPWTQLLGMQDDIEATAYVVMMEAARSAREDVKSIMAGVRAINAAKRHQRELICRINRDVIAAQVAEAEGREIELPPLGLGSSSGYERVAVAIPDAEARGGMRIAHLSLIDGPISSRQHLEAAKDALQSDLDSLSELGEMESLRLQMAMDRMSKMMSTLSNIMKKMSDTSSGITQNMK